MGRRVVEDEGVAGDMWLCWGMLLVEVDCGFGWKALRTVLSRVLVVALGRKCCGRCRL